jgi:hypothetical protein
MLLKSTHAQYISYLVLHGSGFYIAKRSVYLAYRYDVGKAVAQTLGVQTCY